MTDIQIKYWSYKEGARHNYATETQARNELAETGRHNLITEGQGQQSINENVRHNQMSEQIGLIGASASMIQANAAASNAYSNRMNAETNRLVGASTIALNQVKTTAQTISNVVAGTGLKVKAVNSVFYEVGKTAEQVINMGSTMQKNIFNAGSAFAFAK